MSSQAITNYPTRHDLHLQHYNCETICQSVNVFSLTVTLRFPRMTDTFTVLVSSVFMDVSLSLSLPSPTKPDPQMD